MMINRDMMPYVWDVNVTSSIAEKKADACWLIGDIENI